MKGVRLYAYGYTTFCSALIVLALLSISIGYPYLTNSVHEIATPTVQYYVLSDEKCHFYLKFETLDAFMATNPVNVTVQAEPISIDKIRAIRLTFNGATQYFPSNNSENQTFMDIFKDSLMENANILTVYRDNQSRVIFSDNQTYCRFSGQISNITYANAGSYDVYLQFEQTDGMVHGYGGPQNNTSNNNPFILQQAITVSPAENVLQIKSNNITIGLAWIGISLPLMLAGLVGLIEFAKGYFFEKKQPFACVDYC